MTLGSHQTSIGKTQVHITPRWIIEVLGLFDLDPAAADPARGIALPSTTRSATTACNSRGSAAFG
jgi:hypothetical protein